MRKPKAVNRREFLRLSSLGVVATAMLASCTPTAAPTSSPPPVKSEATAAEPTRAQPAQPTQQAIPNMRFTGLSGNYITGFPEAFKEAGKRFGANFEWELTPGADYVPVLLTQFAAGTPPDAFRTTAEEFSTFMGREALHDLTPYMKDGSFNLDAYFPQLLKAYIWKGKYYGIPEDLQPVSPMFYNKQLYEDANEPYPTNDWDWDTCLEVAKRMTKVVGGRPQTYGYHCMEWFWHTWPFAFDTQYVDSSEEPTKFTFTDPLVVDAFQFKVDLIHKHKVSPSPQAVGEAGMAEPQFFMTGRIANYTSGPWETADFIKAGESLRWGMVLTPKTMKGHRKYATGGAGWAIPAGHKQADLLWKVISWVIGPEGMRLIINAKPKPTVWFFSVKEVAQEQARDLAPLIENVDIILKSADWVEWYPRHAKWIEIRDKIVFPQVNMIVQGKVGVAEGLKQLNDDANALLKS